MSVLGRTANMEGGNIDQRILTHRVVSYHAIFTIRKAQTAIGQRNALQLGKCCLYSIHIRLILIIYACLLAQGRRSHDNIRCFLCNAPLDGVMNHQVPFLKWRCGVDKDGESKGPFMWKGKGILHAILDDELRGQGCASGVPKYPVKGALFSDYGKKVLFCLENGGGVQWVVVAIER
ncbi:unnamed protein product [Clonostachys chloroleuca]|uniref:Uncharacterized protein n=1 Tax=Clonostachys chloroleuca TaxID=1926264 RepID=A0AA35VER3_9HYPO|nr:unnamed protein product [Clonostachys chloroleuca]